MASIFLSHSSEDKEFVRDLHKILVDNGINSWIDEAEIKIGDSLLNKISEGIKKADYVAIILSPKSIKSSWVEKELEMAMHQEIERKGIKVLPLIIEDCDVPEYLKIKKYGDFRTPQSSLKSINELLNMLKEKQNELISNNNNKIPQKKEKDFGKFKEIYNIAITPTYAGGMGLLKDSALYISEMFSQRSPNIFRKFKEIYDIAIAPTYAGGMGLDSMNAIKIALKQIAE